MNTPSPLIPQGTTPAKGKVSFFVKVLMILTVHVVVIGGMLLQGCKDTKDQNPTPPPTDTSSITDSVPPLAPNLSNNVASNTAVMPTQPLTGPAATQPLPPTGQLPPPGPIATMPANPLPPVTPLPTAGAPTGEGKEYVIVSGDTLGAVAKHNGVSLKALMEANPGVNPKKLQVGQKIQIPAGTGAATSVAGGATTSDLSGGDSSLYIVKTGDTLGKIAKANHTSYKKIMALNNLKTTSIKIGEKLKMPAPKTATETAPAVPTSAPAPASSTLSPVGSPTLSPAPGAVPPASTGTTQQ